MCAPTTEDYRYGSDEERSDRKKWKDSGDPFAGLSEGSDEAYDFNDDIDESDARLAKQIKMGKC